jgi:hypothetical protein
VRQGYVPEAKTLYLQDNEHDVMKRLRITVSEGVFYLGGSFSGRRLPLLSEKEQQGTVGKQRE